MALYPAPGFLLVEVQKPETTVDGIYHSGSEKDALLVAKVIAVGLPKLADKEEVEIPTFTKTKREEIDKEELQEGNMIYFLRGGDRPLPNQDKKLSILPFEHVLALIEEDESVLDLI